MSDSHETEGTRRDFLYYATAGAGAVTNNRVPDHCSDYMLNRYGGGSEVAVAHNEDNDAFNEGHFVLVTATIGGAPTWTALVYLGELATGAFGFNAAGVAVSLNYLGPDANETVVPGLGRNFVAAPTACWWLIHFAQTHARTPPL